jgi:hypothetical protein
VKFVIPMTATLASRTRVEAVAARDKLNELLQGMMFRITIQARGIPYEGVSIGDPAPHNGMFALPLWAFLESPSPMAVAQSKTLMESLLREPTVRDVIRSNGVPLETVAVGEPSVYQPPR